MKNTILEESTAECGIDSYCTDYDLLNKKIGEKGDICKNLKDSPDKLNGALLLQILKLQEQSNGENRELIYSTIVLSYTATIIALASLGNTIWTTSNLPIICLWLITLVLIIGGNFFIYTSYQKPIHIKNKSKSISHCNDHAINLAYLITIIGAAIWILGTVSEISFFNGIGLPIFIGGASFVVASKTLIYQDYSTDKMEQRLDVLEKKIDLLLKKEQP